MGWRRLGIFASGVLFGTAGVKLLSGRDAKKAYTHVAAAALRGKDCVMESYDKIRENCSDIIADAKEINEKYKADAAISSRMPKKSMKSITLRKLLRMQQRMRIR